MPLSNILFSSSASTAWRYRALEDGAYYVDGRCALGMGRLNIIDLACAH